MLMKWWWMLDDVGWCCCISIWCDNSDVMIDVGVLDWLWCKNVTSCPASPGLMLVMIRMIRGTRVLAQLVVACTDDRGHVFGCTPVALIMIPSEKTDRAVPPKDVTAKFEPWQSPPALAPWCWEKSPNIVKLSSQPDKPWITNIKHCCSAMLISFQRHQLTRSLVLTTMRSHSPALTLLHPRCSLFSIA